MVPLKKIIATCRCRIQRGIFLDFKSGIFFLKKNGNFFENV